MAKKDIGRVRILFAEVEGDNETIQEGLKAIGMAVSKAVQPNTKIIKVLGQADTDDNNLTDIIDEAEALDEEEALDISSNRSKSKRSNRPAKPPSHSIVKDLNLQPEDKISLREFVDEKAPQTKQDLITVAIYYLSQTLEIEGITADHIYTCFKNVGEKIPANIPDTCRKIARKGWIDVSDSKNIKILIHGENFVEHDLPSDNNGKNGSA